MAEFAITEFVNIPINRLHPHPDNPRKDLGDLSELAASIKENGILQNLTVVDDDPEELGSDYTVIIGHRRLAAAKKAGLTELPCVIAEMTPAEQVQTMLLENMQRSDLTVYEQAQGFQMMLDFGFTVEQVAEKSGFSETTVRRRVKMMELDQTILKEVSVRQLTLGDFDELAQIEDLEERNAVLESIGTNDFKMELSRAIGRQNVAQKKPLVEEWLKSVGAKKITREDTWTNKYEGYPGYGGYLYIAKWGESGDTPPEKVEGEIFYYMDSDSLRLFKKREKAKPEKKSPEEQARETAIRDAWKSLDEAASLAYDLRRQFVEKLTVTGKNKADVLYGALLAGMLGAIEYISPDRTSIVKFFDIKTDVYDPARSEKLIAGVSQMKDEDLPLLVYAMFGDGSRELCVDTYYHYNFPQYEANSKLKLLYGWLVRLGYEMSTEEIQLLDGEHAGYHAEEG